MGFTMSSITSIKPYNHTSFHMSLTRLAETRRIAARQVRKTVRKERQNLEHQALERQITNAIKSISGWKHDLDFRACALKALKSLQGKPASTRVQWQGNLGTKQQIAESIMLTAEGLRVSHDHCESVNKHAAWKATMMFLDDHFAAKSRLPRGHEFPC